MQGVCTAFAAGITPFLVLATLRFWYIKENIVLRVGCLKLETLQYDINMRGSHVQVGPFPTLSLVLPPNP